MNPAREIWWQISSWFSEVPAKEAISLAKDLISILENFIEDREEELADQCQCLPDCACKE